MIFKRRCGVKFDLPGLNLFPFTYRESWLPTSARPFNTSNIHQRKRLRIPAEDGQIRTGSSFERAGLILKAEHLGRACRGPGEQLCFRHARGQQLGECAGQIVLGR